MTKKWILYNKEDRQVQWASCINNLSPLENKNPLEGESIARLRESFPWKDELDEAILSIRSCSILGKCSTSRYLKCPNIPDHHRENAQCDPRRYAEDEADYARRYRKRQIDYFNRIGQYYWVDFDVATSDGAVTKLRMVVNAGDADCNDGQWGEVWQRNTGKKVGDISSFGDCGTRIHISSSELEKVIRVVIEIVVFHSWR
jgi:hypothetical protein